MVEKIDSKIFSEEVLNFRGKVLVDFYADWCGPCRMLSPVLDSVASEEEIKVLKINVDLNPDLATEHNVRSLPTVLLFNGGKLVGTNVGYISRSELLSFLDKE